MKLDIPFDNSFARLPERFYARTLPAPVRQPRLIRWNAQLAAQLGVIAEPFDANELAQVFAGNRVPEGAEPIAMAYAGHQFGSWVPQLGDGRAILLGEVVDRAGVRRDVQLKGAGRTPFSRMGDGRAAIGPVLREYVLSEAMAALGIPTTRALAAVTTGEAVIRERALPGAVFTRVATSHVRVGTFEYFANRNDTEAVRLLADYVIARHYPHAVDDARPYHALLDAIIGAQAALIARWMLVGFIHGVMNTDNTSVAGETIDYGPCAFLDEYHQGMVFSSIDRMGRYAFGNQPTIAHWNLARLAECLLPLLRPEPEAAVEDAMALLETFPTRYGDAYRAGMRAKLGLHGEEEADDALAAGLLQVMQDNGADFTLTFRRLADSAVGPEHDVAVRRLFIEPAAFDRWAGQWRERLAREPGTGADRQRQMRSANPAFIPRNHRVEAVIAAAMTSDDYGPFEELLTVLARPFDDQPAFRDYMQPPAAHERVRQTFCGT